jgi:hypothetical protein
MSEPDAWILQGVHGIVTLVFHGEVVMVHTSDDHLHHPDALFSRTAEGRPTEMTRTQALHLAEILFRILGEDPPSEALASVDG